MRIIAVWAVAGGAISERAQVDPVTLLSMDAQKLFSFLRSHRFAVQASLGNDAPQAAVVGFAISDGFEIVFDTLQSTRKAINLRRNPRIALVIGGVVPGDERTVQYEGIADEPAGEDLQRLKRVYFSAFPDGPSRADWPGLIYFRVRPTWIRYSDYNQNPAEIVEFQGRSLAAWIS